MCTGPGPLSPARRLRLPWLRLPWAAAQALLLMECGPGLLNRRSLSALCPPSPKAPRPASPWKVVSLAGSRQNGIALVPRDGKWSFLLGNSRHTGKSPKAS